MTMSCNGLAKLLEECGELVQIASKKLAYFHTDQHPDGAGSLQERMEDEMGDVLAAITFCIFSFGLNAERIQARTKMKLERFMAWHEDSNA
jgi:NTP pyrophosphatase (non-canonical NTP hydrolase)